VCVHMQAYLGDEREMTAQLKASQNHPADKC